MYTWPTHQEGSCVQDHFPSFETVVVAVLPQSNLRADHHSPSAREEVEEEASLSSRFAVEEENPFDAEGRVREEGSHWGTPHHLHSSSSCAGLDEDNFQDSRDEDLHNLSEGGSADQSEG